MRLRVEQTVEGVEPDEAMAWWTDFSPGREDHGFVPGAHRRVQEMDEGTLIEDRVRWLGLTVFTERVRAHERGNKVELVGENSLATFRARYVFEHTFDPDGTLVRLVADISGRGPLTWVERLARPLVSWILRWDTRKHLDDMHEDLAPDPSPG